MSVLGALLALAGLALLGAALAERLRASRLPRSLVVEYTPRRGASVLGDAVLAGRERRAATAALLDLAVRRRIRLVVDESHARRTSVGVEVVAGAALTTRDLALLDAVSDPARTGRLRRFSRDRRRTGLRVRALVDATAASLTRQGLLLAGPSVARPVLRRFAALVLLVSIGAGLLALTLGDAIATSLAGTAVAASLAALATIPRGASRRFTASALPLRRHLDGLRQYLVVAEQDRLRVLHGPRTAEVDADVDVTTGLGRLRLHERLLPYAVLFGVEREWLAELRVAYDDLDDVPTILGDAADAVDVAADLLLLAHALDGFTHLVASLDGVSDAAGGAFDVADALGSLTDLLP